jgi:predicted nucleotidyltransferase
VGRKRLASRLRVTQGELCRIERRDEPGLELGSTVTMRFMAVEPRALARTLMTRHRSLRAGDEARAAMLRERVATAAPVLLRDAGASRAWLIGSLAWGGFGVRSDVDLVVEGVPNERIGEAWAALSNALDAPVDVLRLETLPAPFRARVLAEGVLLVGATSRVP